jgi:hypothetical protein
VHTAQFKGWDTLSNGELLNAAEETGFDVPLTTDRRIRWQQNRKVDISRGHAHVKQKTDHSERSKLACDSRLSEASLQWTFPDRGGELPEHPLRGRTPVCHLLVTAVRRGSREPIANKAAKGHATCTAIRIVPLCRMSDCFGG